MATTELTPFSELIPGWPEHAPRDGIDLILLEDDALRALGLDGDELELVTKVRRHLRMAALSRGSSTQLSNANAVVAALDSGDLRVYQGHWLLIVLDKHRRRVFAPQRKEPGTSRAVVQVSKWVPDDPSRLPGLPEGGTYLVLWGGSVEVLAIPDVRERLRQLAAVCPISDVVFRRRGKALAGSGEDAPVQYSAPTTWSLREGIGVRAGEPVPFPESTNHEEVNLWD